MTRRKREILGLRNERDFPRLMHFTVNDVSQSAAAGVDTRSSKSIFDSASKTPPLRMHFAIASVASA